jgi:uncharacterized membrane protein
LSPPPSPQAAWRWQRVAVTLAASLVLLECLWEIVLAPVKPGGTWLAVKALPLALLWPGLARGHAKVRQLATLLLPFYFAEALVRALTESGRHAMVASVASCIAATAFAALLLSFRAARHARGS